VLAAGLSLLAYALGLLIRNPAAAVAVLLLWPLLIDEVLISGLLDATSALQVLPYAAGLNMAAIEPDETSSGECQEGSTSSPGPPPSHSSQRCESATATRKHARCR
jgi:hypothetical protein